MSKSKYVTRTDVLKALRSEPLQSGRWVDRDNPSNKCEVCAVGAVLRKSGMNNYEIDSFGEGLLDNFYGLTASSVNNREEENQTIAEHLAGKAFLPALSLKFECQAGRTGTGQRTRKILVEFVKKNFPDKIKLTYTKGNENV